MSETFIQKHEGQVFWDLIAKFQKMSKGFIGQHINKFDLKFLYENQKLDQEELREMNLEVLKELVI